MKTPLLFLILLLSLPLGAQTLSINSGTTYAVVIGISDYQDDRIPDLQYAHKDAAAFVGYLKSPAGGTLTSEQIFLLMNEKATNAQMGAALDWLIEVCKSGDKAIIYYSGHSDVETKTRRQHGFLLAYDTPANNYRAGAYALWYLQTVVETLSLENKAQVTIILDACRAGKLAGSEIGGAQAVTAALKEQYVNEVKILSCQPDEFSLEGREWGDGRGCFSFHLIDGLYGMADKNQDLSVSLFELERYIEDRVSIETAPHSQIPITVGSKGTLLSVVDLEILEKLKARKKKEQPQLTVIESKGMEVKILEQLDTNIQELYHKFIAAIDQGNLLAPEGQSANDYYLILSKEPSLKQMHGIMKRNFAAVLQDSAQQTLNAFLRSERDFLVQRWFLKEKYPFPKYLERASELLGTSHYLYPTLKAKQYYFEAWNLIFSRQGKDRVRDSLTIIEVLNKFQLAHSLDSTAAYIYEGLAYGYRTSYFEHTDSSIICLQKAIELAPTWPIPYFEIARINSSKGNYDKAEFWYKKSIKTDTTFFGAYNSLASLYRRTNQMEKAEKTLKKALTLDSTDYYNWFSLASMLGKQGRYKEAIQAYLTLGNHLPDKVQIRAKYNMNLLEAYLIAGHLEEAKKHCQEMLEMKMDSAEAYSGLGYVKLYNGEYEQAWHYFEKSSNISDNLYYKHLIFASYYAMTNEFENALDRLEKALKNGNRDYYWIHSNKSFEDLRKTKKFKDIIQKYFPGANKK